MAGSLDDNKAQIKLSGAHILPEHCTFVNEEGVVTVEAMPDARMFVNGKRLAPRTPAKLLNGFRVILGDFHVFRFNDPGAVRLHRQRLIGSSTPGQGASDPSPNFRPDTPSRGDGEMMDWSAARREVADIEKLGDHDLERLFDDIVSRNISGEAHGLILGSTRSRSEPKEGGRRASMTSQQSSSLV